VREALLHAQFMGVAPRVARLVGVIPSAVRDRHRALGSVRAALPAALGRVLEELAALGVALRRGCRRASRTCVERPVGE